MSNINDSYFDGYYKDIWKKIIPEQLTVKEVDFMISYFKLLKADRILDLMCGYGRHSIALARRGMEVTAVDNLKEYIDDVREISIRENLNIDAVQANVISYRTAKTYDLAICMGNSLNFFPPEDIGVLFSNVYSHLKANAFFLINSWSIYEIASNTFKEESQSVIDDVQYFTKSNFLQSPPRIETESTIVQKSGQTEIKKSVDYIYSIPDIEGVLSKSGLKFVEAFSIPGKKVFIPGEPRVYILARKEI
jgi:SAM-dependent methyltransferase